MVERQHAPGGLGAIIGAIRPRHQVKNLLVFVPWLAHHGPFDLPHLGRLLLAFAAFALAASATYLVNDVFDREADRAHPSKARRPIAAGRLPLAPAVVLALVLLGGAIVLATALLPRDFTLLLLVYIALSMAYSLGLKRIVVIDVLVLSALYVVRVLAGGAAVAIWTSPWLLGLCSFLFLSLAFLKRYAELRVRETGSDERLPGRGYIGTDLDILRVVGPACGCLAVLVLALYVTSDQVARQYRTPEVLWLATPALLYWIVRVWILVHRGEVDDDPVVFATSDPASCATAVWILAVGAAAAAGV